MACGLQLSAANPHYQRKGYGGTAPAAFPLQLQLLRCCSCGNFPAAAVMQQHFGCCFRAAGAVALVLLLHVGGGSLQPTSAPLPTEGLWGCCTGSHPIAIAAADMPQWLQLPLGTHHAAARQLLFSSCRWCSSRLGRGG